MKINAIMIVPYFLRHVRHIERADYTEKNVIISVIVIVTIVIAEQNTSLTIAINAFFIFYFSLLIAL